jgi:peroxiredoxin
VNKYYVILLTVLLNLVLTAPIQAKAIAQNNQLVSPLLNGQFIPDVTIKTIDGQEKKLANVLNNKKTVLFFYRGGWCPYCNMQMGQLKKIESRLQNLGFQLIGISTDSNEDLQKSVKEHALPYQLISDYTSKVSQAFGLAYFASQKVTDRYLAKMKLSNPLQKNDQGISRLILPAPAIYLIDEKGLVQFNYVNANYKVRLHEALLLKAAELM